MSYARSPRPVCSITIGTSNWSPLPFTLLILQLGLLRGIGSDLRGLMIQKVEGLFVADSIPDSIQRPIACQSRPDSLRCLLRLLSQSHDLAIDLRITDLDLFLLGDFLQQQRSLHFLYRLIPLPASQPVQIHLLHVFRLHALSCERPQSAVKTNIDLVLDQRLRHLKIIALYQLRHQFVFSFALGVVFFLRLHALTDSFPYVSKVGKLSQGFRKLV